MFPENLEIAPQSPFSKDQDGGLLRLNMDLCGFAKQNGRSARYFVGGE
jgi:hypothetical protein